MNYRYIVIYRVEGISSSNLENDKVLFQDTEHGVTVILTSDINRHCDIIDTGLACAGLLLRGMFGDEKSQELPEAIKSEVEKLQEERISKNKNGTYVVIILEGKEELEIKENLHRETDQFRICFDAIDKEAIRKKHIETIHATIASLAISTSPEYHAEKITTGLYFIDDNKKPLYSFSFQGGRARLILSKPISEDIESEIKKNIGLSYSNKQLKTPFRLLTQSLETTNDNLRAFLLAWSSIEILTNKVFPYYEDKFVSGIAYDHNSHGVNNFFDRIKDVMKDKYRLTDKFTLLASFLSSEVTEDIEQFKHMKKIRDTISHGNEFDEETLPIEDARKIAAKYLKHHMWEIECA